MLATVKLQPGSETPAVQYPLVQTVVGVPTGEKTENKQDGNHARCAKNMIATAR